MSSDARKLLEVAALIILTGLSESDYISMLLYVLLALPLLVHMLVTI